MDRNTLNKHWEDTAIQLFGNKPQVQDTTTPTPTAPIDYSLNAGSGSGGNGPSVLNRIFGVLGAQQQGVLGGIRGVQEIEQEKRSGNLDPLDYLRPIGGVVGGIQDSLAVTFGGKGDNLQTPEDIVTRQYAMGSKDIAGGNFDTSKNAAVTAGMNATQLEEYRKRAVKPQYEEYKKNSSIAEKSGRTIGDLAMYVATDPLTYETAGISAGVKGLVALFKGAKDISKAAEVTNAAEATIANVPEGITAGQATAAQTAGRVLETGSPKALEAAPPKALEAGTGQIPFDFPTNVVAKPAEQLAPKVESPFGQIPGQEELNLSGKVKEQYLDPTEMTTAPPISAEEAANTAARKAASMEEINAAKAAVAEGKATPEQLSLFDIPPGMQIPKTAEQLASKVETPPSKKLMSGEIPGQGNLFNEEARTEAWLNSLSPAEKENWLKARAEWEAKLLTGESTTEAAVAEARAAEQVKLPVTENPQPASVVKPEVSPAVEPKSFKSADGVIANKEAQLAEQAASKTEQAASKTPKTDALVETPKYDPVRNIELEPGVVVPRTPVTEKAAELVAKSNMAFEETRAAGKLPPRIGNKIFGSERATNIIASILENPIFKAKGVGVTAKAQELLDPFKIVSIGGKQFTLDIQALAQILTKVPGAESTPILTKFVDPITETLGSTKRVGEIKVQKLDAEGKVVKGSEEVQSVSGFDPATLLTQVLTGMGDDANRVGMHTLEDILTGGKEGITVDSVMSLSGGVKITVGDFLKEMKLARKEADNYLKSRAAIVVMEDSAKPLMQAAKTPVEAEQAAVVVEDTYQAIKETPEMVPTNKTPEQPPHRIDSTVRDGKTPKNPNPQKESLKDSKVKVTDSQGNPQTFDAVTRSDEMLNGARQNLRDVLNVPGVTSAAANDAKRMTSVAELFNNLMKDVFVPRINVGTLEKPNFVPHTRVAIHADKTLEQLVREFGAQGVIHGHVSIPKLLSMSIHGREGGIGLRGLFTKMNSIYHFSGAEGLKRPYFIRAEQWKKSFSELSPKQKSRIIDNLDEQATVYEKTLADLENTIESYGIPQVATSDTMLPMRLSQRLELAAKDISTEANPVRVGHFLSDLTALKDSGVLTTEQVKAISKLMDNSDFITGSSMFKPGYSVKARQATKDYLDSTFPTLKSDARSVRDGAPTAKNGGGEPKMPSPEDARNPQTGHNAPNEGVRVQTERINSNTGGKPPRTVQEAQNLGRADDVKVAKLIEDSVDSTVRGMYTAEDIIQSVGASATDELRAMLGIEEIKGPIKWLRNMSARMGHYGLADKVLFNNLGLGRRLQGELDNFGKEIVKTKATAEEIQNASKYLIGHLTEGFDTTLVPKLTAKEEEVFNLLNRQIEGTFGRTNSIMNSSNISLEHIQKYLGAVGFRGGMRISGASNHAHPFLDILDRLRPAGGISGETAIDMFHANPVEFMQQMNGALLKSVSEKFVKNDLMYVVGQDTAKGLVDPIKFGGRYFEREVAQQIPSLLKAMDELLTYTSNGGSVMRTFDEIQSVWKTLNTIVIPGHHIRNMNGDLFMSFLSSPRYSTNPARMASDYKDAVGVLQDHASWYGSVFRSSEGSYDSIVAGIESKLAGGEGLNIASKTGKSRTVITVGDMNLSSSDIYSLAYNRGLLQQLHVVEDLNVSGASSLSDELTANANVVKKLARGNAKLQNTIGVKQASGLSVSREHSVRMMDLVGDLKAGLAKEFKGRKNIPKEEFDAAVIRIADQSAKRIRKIHPDGLNLTTFERNYLRRVFPFYSYTRGIVPSFLEFAGRSPAKALIPNKVYSSVQQNFYSGNVNPATGEDPNLPTLPGWVYGAYPQGPLFGIETPTGTAAIAANPGQTSIDLPRQLLDPRGTLSSNLTPGLKLPFEALTKKDSRTGQQIDWTDWALKNTPVASVVYRGAAGANPGAQPGSLPWLNAFNSLSGVGAQEINKESYIKSAQFQQGN